MTRFVFLQHLSPALRGLLIGLLAATMTWCIVLKGGLESLERSAMNALFRTRGERAPRTRIVILTMDDDTAAHLKQATPPRQIYADAIRRVTAAGAKTIALDILFDAPTDETQDAALESACRASGRVVQAATFNMQSSEAMVAPPLPTRFALTDAGTHCHSASRVAAALDRLQRSAPALGHLNLYPRNDAGALRRMPHLVRYQNHLYPSLVLAAATHFSGQAPQQVVAGGAIHLPLRRGTPYDIPLNAGGETWVNWLGDNTFPTFSFYQLLFERRRRVQTQINQSLKDSIVIMGVMRQGAFTSLTTPFSPRESALDFQANAIDDIVARRCLRETSLPWQVALLFGFTLLGGALMGPRSAWGALAWMLGLDALLWAGATLALTRNLYVPPATPLLANLVTCGLCISYRQTHEARELKRVRDIFGGYVGDEVLRQLQGHLPTVGGETRHVAVLFCDIRGFTPLAEQLQHEPAQLLRLLNAHFEPLVQSLKQHGAYVDNYIGDLVIALFGVPVSSGSPASDTCNAVLAAVDLVRLINERNARWIAAGQAPLEAGVGVHCGLAVVGNLGTSQKMHYTAVGDTINVGSRTESATRLYETPLLVTEAVIHTCSGHPALAHLEWESVGATAVKGRTHPVHLYRCKNLSPAPILEHEPLKNTASAIDS